ARAMIRRANSACVVTSRRSTWVSCAPPLAKWTWASLKPGMTRLPPASTTCVFGPRHRSISSDDPTSTMRPPMTATASACGRAASPVQTAPCVTTRSAARFGGREQAEASSATPRSRLRKVADRGFELRDKAIELTDDGADGFRFTEIDAGALQQRHRMVAAAGLQQRQIPIDCRRAVRFPAAGQLIHQLRARGKAGRVLVHVVRRAVEMRNPRPRHTRQLVVVHRVAMVRLQQVEVDVG